MPGRSHRCQDRTVRTDVAYLIADPEPELTLEHIPGLVVSMMDVKRRERLVARVTRVGPLNEHESAAGPAQLAATEGREEEFAEFALSHRLILRTSPQVSVNWPKP